MTRSVEQRTSHTPGPWQARGMGGYSVVLCPTKPSRNDLRIPGYAYDETVYSVAYPFLDDEGGIRRDFVCFSHSDARLIAAAPDLLALAKKLAGECAECRGRGYTFSDDGITGFGPDDREPTREHCAECADIRAVIAKAEGRS